MEKRCSGTNASRRAREEVEYCREHGRNQGFRYDLPKRKTFHPTLVFPDGVLGEVRKKEIPEGGEGIEEKITY